MGLKLLHRGARIGSRAVMVCLVILLLSLAFAPVQNWIEGAAHPHAAPVSLDAGRGSPR